ncbi:S-layer homology domain-containing protein [Intestinimonas massiliensis (ex Afouda et al. 2020)]|uniref:S-layer homology domain-containing protein n=1 Tax=Intestinimonas massiliensis (ex Afouda et al. 2020) TaxID=1673721 RepID=UPI0010313433|nr:S-layer homology domain-containing protein [Intestinimonas massiliensis (ex Afouda et al. 2020)]
MRNLKRALSLVLAAMMLIGMMVVSAGAASKDFTDKAEIKHPEAVNTLVALNVISGKEDGSYFDPNGTLTRAEMAKLVTYVLNGGTEPVLGTKVTPTYKDIKGHWAEAYIEYCTSMNIIVGDGTGKFNPEGTLTASQCAKMLLTAMNYKDDVFGFTGNSWEINVNREANAAGLYKNLGGVAASQPITRDNAAQMVYNAIQSKTMKLSWSQDMTTGQITQTYNLTGNSLFEDKFGGQIFVGSFDGNSDTLSIKDGYIQVTGNLTTDDTTQVKAKTATFPYTLDIAGVGEDFKVIYKEGTGGTDGKPDANDTIYGVYNAGTTDVLKVTSNDIKSAKDYATAGKIKVDGTEYELATPAKDQVLVVTDFGAVANVTATTGDVAEAKTAFSALSGANGNTVKFILNEDGKVSKAYVQTYELGTVTAVNSEKVSISGLGSIKIADNAVYSGIAKNDVVVYSKLYNKTAADAYVVVTKAETVSGTVNGYKNQENVTLDGTVYKIYNGTDMIENVGGETGVKAFGDSSFGETFTLYLVNGYVRAAVQTSESASNYSLVLDATGSKGSTFNPLKLQVLAADGTKSIITVDKDSTSDPKKGDIVTYTGTADKALVKVEALGKDMPTSSSKDFYNKTSKTVEGVVTAGDAVLFVNVGTEYKAYNIRSLGDITTTSKDCKIIVKDGKVVAASIDLGSTPSGATSTAIYGMVIADNGTVKIDETVYTSYTVWTTDGEKTVNVKNGGKLTVGTIYKYEPTADNTYAADAFKAHGGEQAAIKSYDQTDKLLTYMTGRSGEAPNATFAKTETKAVADNLTVLYVNCKDNTAGDEIGINTYDDITDLYNALIITNDDGVITHIVIETSGEVDVKA